MVVRHGGGGERRVDKTKQLLVSENTMYNIIMLYMSIQIFAYTHRLHNAKTVSYAVLWRLYNMINNGMLNRLIHC